MSEALTVGTEPTNYTPVTRRDVAPEVAPEAGAAVAVTPRAGALRAGARRAIVTTAVDCWGVVTESFRPVGGARSRSHGPAAAFVLRWLHWLWAEGPCPPAERWSYTRAGGWVRGDRHWTIEAPGYLFGYTLAVPTAVVARLFTAAANGLAWSTARGTRAVVVYGIAAALWLAHGWQTGDLLLVDLPTWLTGEEATQ